MTSEVHVEVEVISEPVLAVKTSAQPPVSTVMHVGGRGLQGPQGPVGDDSTVPGPVGPQGVIGPQGPQGEVGPAGMSSQAFPYRWKIATAETDPGAGFVQADNADPTLITEFYISVYDRNGQAFLPITYLVADDEFYLYESGQIGTWNRYFLTGAPIPNQPIGTPPDWAIIPVVYDDTGPLPLTPINNTNLLVTTPVKGEPGPAGPMGAQGPAGADSTVPGPEGPMGEVPIITLTQAAYDALPTPDSNTLYVISDGPGPVQGEQGEQGDPGDPTTLVTVSTDPPSGIPASDGLLWVVIP